ncbi:filamentous growth regulator 23 [Acyrthosiphon pisum]|uniref:Chitin-binding type-2 domain-containing protein n=1 Tax=Acyrthosiphon pisum TaxID=7029 RepID=A0A8R2A9G9_ACYPI|nr:filamentous growth regulator 23 [Acyrthosiphon pisum]|eukprot:XP_001942936.2 PREDICTED: filamentous growth regulator 23 [Acyrthosiphon pisum]
MKRNWITTDRLWCLFLILAVSRITESSSKNINQVKLPIPTKESLPQVAEALKAATYLEDSDELEKNFEGQRDSYKRSPRKLGTEDLDKNSELQEYQGVMGRPGVDFPILPSIPHTDFSCKKVKKPGYYADPETDCQVFHICDNGRKVSFLCPNGTIFRQSHLICDWWFRVDCERSVELYEESAEQLASDQRVFKERAETLAKAMLKVQTTTQTSYSDRVVTERSFGPSTTIFNSESRLPDRARYFSDYSRDESQVPAETGSFAGKQFQTNFNNYYPQSKSPVQNWNQGNYQTQPSTTAQPIWNGNYQSSTYQAQSTITARPTWNQAAYNNYQTSSYQSPPVTTAQPSIVQGINNFQSSYQPQFTTSAQSVQGATSSQVAYQQQPTTMVSQTNWNQGSNNYQTGNYQTIPTTTATQMNWNNHGNNDLRINNNYQSHTPSTTQPNWSQSSSSNYQSENYQSPSTTEAAQANWNNQGSKNVQTENYQTSQSTTPTPVSWNNQGSNHFGTSNSQKQVTTTLPQTNWNGAVNNFQSNSYNSQPITTIQPDWNQESDTLQPNLFESQQPTTVFPTDNEQTIPAKESQVPAESASFVGHQNSPRFNFQPDNYNTQTPQTNVPPTTYPVTSSYTNDYSPNGAFSFVEYQRSPDTPVARDSSTQASPVMTTVLDYNSVDNSTLSPSGETLIPNMINSLQSLTDNNLLFDLDGQNTYPSQTNSDDELNSVALYFNNVKNPQVTTVASDLQFNRFEQTSRAYTNGLSSTTIDSVETTTPVDNLHIPAILTQNTKEAYDKLFRNDTVKESMITLKLADTSKPVENPTNSVNLGFAQGLTVNRSSVELRELAAVFTRALTAYLDDPENFRKILAEVRPTEPPSVKTSVTEEQEVLDFSDDSKRQRGKPTEPSTSSPNIAAEINGMTQSINVLTDLSTIVPQYTSSPLIEITSKYTETSNAGLQEYAPPEDSEQLQLAGSHSFYSSRDNSIQTAKTLKPAASTLTWTVSPLIDTDQDIKSTTQSPVYFTTTAEDLETTVIVQRAKEMFSHLNASEAGVLMNVMKTAQVNDTVKRLVLLLVNDSNKENSPEQTRNNLIEALLENRSTDQAFDVSSSSPTTTFLPSSPSEIPFGQRIQEDGSPVQDGQYKKSRKGARRRVVHRSRSTPVSTTPMTSNTWQGANDVGPGLSDDSDARAVELLKSLYSIASKWS